MRSGIRAKILPEDSEIFLFFFSAFISAFAAFLSLFDIVDSAAVFQEDVQGIEETLSYMLTGVLNDYF